jgi:MFS family permease
MLRIKRFSLGIVGNILASTSVTYIAPSLSIALKMIGFDPDSVGVCFCIPALMYIVSCLITPSITQRLPKRLVLAIGLHILAGAMFMIGSDGSFIKMNPEYFILSGLFFLGISAAMIMTPMTPEQ